MRRAGLLLLASFAVVPACSLLLPASDLSAGGGDASAAHDDGGDDGARDGVASGDDGGGASDTSADTHIDTTGYRYRRRITIANAGTAPLPAGLTLGVSFDTFATASSAGEVRADGADLRVVRDATMDERPRVLDLPGPTPGSAFVWFALKDPIAAGASDTSYALYYGDASATTPPADGKQVFPIYDDFDAPALSTTTWSSTGSPTQGDGGLTLHRSSGDGVLQFGTNDGVPATSVFETRLMVTDPASVAGLRSFFYWFGYQRTGDFTEATPWSLWIARDPSTVRAELAEDYVADGGACQVAWCTGNEVPQVAGMRTYRIERGPTDTRYYIDGALVTTLTYPPHDYAVMFRNYAATSDLVVDWVRVRALVTPPPAVTLAAEEKLF